MKGQSTWRKGKEAELMGYARRAKGLTEEVRDLGAGREVGDEEVGGVLRRAGTLQGDLTNQKGVEGIRVSLRPDEYCHAWKVWKYERHITDISEIRRRPHSRPEQSPHESSNQPPDTDTPGRSPSRQNNPNRPPTSDA